MSSNEQQLTADNSSVKTSREANSDSSTPLSHNIRLLGQLLGNSIKANHQDDVLELVERIRQLAKAARDNNPAERQKLTELLLGLSDKQMLSVARAFSHFLNLANIAEQQQSVLESQIETDCSSELISQLLQRLKAPASKLNTGDIIKAIESLRIEVVLTAHPTEISRRTYIQKHQMLHRSLERLSQRPLGPAQSHAEIQRLGQLITQLWNTDEIRQERPTPVDEAKWGFNVIEQSLWFAVPQFLRSLHELVQDELDYQLPLNWTPFHFASWMGGDRDGNPFVTAKVTKEVLLSSRWMAMDLFFHDVEQLCAELSITPANQTLLDAANQSHEPYRLVLRQLRDEIKETREHLTGLLTKKPNRARNIIRTNQDLLKPLMLCYQSLLDCDLADLANGALRDTIWRVHAFGACLLRLDVRQNSDRHTQVLSELTRYLGIGDYQQWSETDRQNFLYTEIASRRPLLPANWQPSPEAKEVLDTCSLIARTTPEALGMYVISMAQQASDILAVKLLLQEAGCKQLPPIAPLFETLDDLDRSERVIGDLLDNTNYRAAINGVQPVMIGYSDSAKDAGFFAAGWAQYRAQENLVTQTEKHGVKLVLFHGRGGTVGRGGAPAHDALLSQPPGSLSGGLRVTEQGEMIRFKFGLPDVALLSLSRYLTANLEANLLPPPKPKAEWRAQMDQLAATSCAHYREFLERDDFIPYFQAATPLNELGNLPLGSRPAKRKTTGSLESLRAIPWIFSWSQNRLLLPVWLGTTEALAECFEKNQVAQLEEMQQSWPFFRSRLAMLEMVFAKTEPWLFELYNEKLVPEEQRFLGEDLVARLTKVIEQVKVLIPSHCLLQDNPVSQASIELRNPYIDPLNILQVELLRRSRMYEEDEKHQLIEQALMVTIAGISAGLRNTA